MSSYQKYDYFSIYLELKKSYIIDGLRENANFMAFLFFPIQHLRVIFLSYVFVMMDNPQA